jgi:hypothetical protein
MGALFFEKFSKLDLNNSGLYSIIRNMSEEDFDEYGGPKDYDEQTDAFRFDLDDLVERYLHEFDINTITMIGALQEKIQELVNDGSFESEIEIDE